MRNDLQLNVHGNLGVNLIEIMITNGNQLSWNMLNDENKLLRC